MAKVASMYWDDNGNIVVNYDNSTSETLTQDQAVIKGLVSVLPNPKLKLDSKGKGLAGSPKTNKQPAFVIPGAPVNKVSDDIYSKITKENSSAPTTSAATSAKPTPKPTASSSAKPKPSASASSAGAGLPSFDTGDGASSTGTDSTPSSYKVDVGFGLVDKNGNSLSLPPIQIGSYITTLAGTDPKAYARVRAAVAALTGKSKLDPSYVGGYLTKLATNIMASSDILARTGSLEDYFNTAAKNASGGTSSLPQSYLSSETQAKSDINTVFDKLLGREATDKEINALTVVLNDAQKKNPSKYVNGVTYGGLDKNQFLIDVITSGRYEGKPNAYPGILANLAEEASGVKAKTAATKAGKEEATLLSNKTNILKTAQANGLAINEDDVNNYLSQVQAGKDINVVLQAIRDNGAVGMPDSVKKIVGAGVDLASVYSPYKTLLSQTLEINPNDISLNDPTLRMAIGPDKEMSLYEYQRALRKDNRWQYTNQARTEASDVARTVLKDFGFMG